VSTAHQTLAVVVVAVAVAAAAAGAYAYRVTRTRSVGAFVGHLLALAQTVLIAQVALGLLLLSDDRRASEELHYAYGALALGAVLAPWLYAPAEPRRRLLWFTGATLLAGALAVRALMTG
jgi:fucose permease